MTRPVGAPGVCSTFQLMQTACTFVCVKQWKLVQFVYCCEFTSSFYFILEKYSMCTTVLMLLNVPRWDLNFFFLQCYLYSVFYSNKLQSSCHWGHMADGERVWFPHIIAMTLIHSVSPALSCQPAPPFIDNNGDCAEEPLHTCWRCAGKCSRRGHHEGQSRLVDFLVQQWIFEIIVVIKAG